MKALTSILASCLLTTGLARAQTATSAGAQAPAAPETEPAPAAAPTTSAPTADAAAAPAAPVAPSSDPRAQARALYEEATREYAKGNYGSALERLDQAFALHDAPTLLLARAHTLDKLAKTGEAVRAYTAYLRRRPDDPEAATIRARVSELQPPPAPAAATPAMAPTGVTLGDEASPGDAGAEEEDKPRPNEKRYRDQLFFFRAGATGGLGSATRELYLNRYDLGYSGEEVEHDASPSFAGVSLSGGVTPVPGFSIALGVTAAYLSAELEMKAPPEVYESTDDDDDSLDAGGGLFIPALEVHGFPWPKGPLHLMASGGLLTGGGEEFDDFFGFAAGAGIGAAFFVGDQTSIDILARAHYMPSGDRDSTMLLWSLDCGVLLQ